MLIAGCLTACASPPLPPAAVMDRSSQIGPGQQTADLGGTPVQVFTYRPADCTISAILLVFHGLERNAGGYRNDAIPLAQRYCMLIVAPLFDKARFPSWSYQRGGIVHHSAVEPPDAWTVRYVPRLVAWVRRQENRPDLPYVQIGHSAGAQFLSRVVAFSPDDAQRTILANPSTWVRPSLDVAAPYGFGGTQSPDGGEPALRRYLAAHVTVLLGQDDRGSKNLTTSGEAEDQGANRFTRGKTVFEEAQGTARAHGWPFNWQLAEVPGVGHNAGKMFNSAPAFAALRP